MRIALRPLAFATLAGVMGMAGEGTAAPRDLAARGLDLFVHAPDKVASGGRLVVQVRVFGFMAVATPVPLPGAELELSWDPESLGKNVAAAPPPVRAKADDAGLARLLIQAPAGDGKLKLLLHARWHDHERTREIEVSRLAAREIDLRVSDTAVVPGGAVAAWVLVRDSVSGQPSPGTAVDVELKEGTAARFSKRVVTDRAGTAATQVPIPFTDNPDWNWTLSARTATGGADDVSASRTLSVREERPGAPALSVRWSPSTARPGTPASYSIEVRDATRSAIAGLPVRYWVGPQGTKAPDEEAAWLRASTAATTDSEGKIQRTMDTPAAVSSRGGSLTVEVRAAIDGHLLSDSASLPLREPKPVVDVVPELGVLLPGVTQRVFVHVTDGERPLSLDLALEGHGLAARIKTNERGWAGASWSVPADVGARVPDGASSDCAGSVAATVRVRPLSAPAGLASHPQPFAACLTVDREMVATVRPLSPIVRAGDAIGVRMVERRAAGRPASRGATSVIAMPFAGGTAATTWLGESGHEASVTIPSFGHGVWTLSAAGTTGRPAERRRASDAWLGQEGFDADREGDDDGTDSGEPAVSAAGRVLASGVLVVPRVLPVLAAKLVSGGASARSTSVQIDADLGDGRGQPLTGSIGAVVLDKHGGGHPDNLLALDTRRATVRELGVAAADVDGFLEGDGRYDVERWAALAQARREGLSPVLDPVAGVRARIDAAFAAVVRSLEGAVYESSGDPERLSDVRVRTATGFALNPEMLTLVTEAMSEKPLTPGGEPWRLGDLMAVDRQVTYDNVARRVTRLKLFRVLSAIRSHVYESKLGLDEPAMSDPNALLRRLVRRETIAASDLLDPWSRGLAFVRSPGPRIPFLSIVPGYRLLSAGPDGRFGTPDDVRDPFQRVLGSRTPYGRAAHEDRIVDARWDMRVGDDTVEAWKDTLEKLTGTELGDAYGVGGLGSVGSLGHGGGYGSGGGGLGGRGTHGIDVGPAEWLPPVRTDDRGHVRLSIPLRDADTTWQIVLVAIPDQASPAVTSVEVPVSSALTVRVDAGASWIVGDDVGVAITVRNRTDRALSPALRVASSGAATLIEPASATRSLAVAARSAATTIVRVRGSAVGVAVLDASVNAPGLATDNVRHQWQVKPAGETYVATNGTWVDRSANVALPAVPAGSTGIGAGRLVLERGVEPALSAALESLQPENLTGVRAIADAMEVFGRVRAWAIASAGETSALAVRASELAARAMAHLSPAGRRRHDTDVETPLHARATRWEEVAARSVAAKPSRKDAAAAKASKIDCPPSGGVALATRLDWLDVAPAADRGSERTCWAAFMASATQELAATSDLVLMAHAVLALRDRPGQSMVAAALADRLRAAVPVRTDGTVVLPTPTEDRASRSIVMAALVRASTLGRANAATSADAARLAGRLRVDRDASGGYGSSQATRVVVRTLLESSGADTRTASVTWRETLTDGRTGASGRIEVPGTRSVTIPLSSTAAAASIESSIPGVIARIERPMLRSFLHASDPGASPVHLQVEVPAAPTALGTALLHVSVRHDLARRAEILVRAPLPPGAALAEHVEGIRQVQGALYLRTRLDADPLPRVFAIPLRFALSGRVTLPEIVARVDDEEFAPARASARPLVIQSRR